MTPKQAIAHLRRQILRWAERADEQGGNPYYLVSSSGNPWNYAASFIDYECEGIGHFPCDGTATLFLLFVAATLESDDAPS